MCWSAVSTTPARVMACESAYGWYACRAKGRGMRVAVGILSVIGVCHATWPALVVRADGPGHGDAELRMRVLFDSTSGHAGWHTGWGYAALLQLGEQTVLFDTGADGQALLSNLARAGVRPSEIDHVVLSHDHPDHAGGLATLLQVSPHPEVHIPRGASIRTQQVVRAAGARLTLVSRPTRIAPRVHSTGPLGKRIPEQALVLTTETGLVVVAGCAHPGLERMLRAARRLHRRPIDTVAGGWHLLNASRQRIRRVIAALRRLDVRRVIPGHCTGRQMVRALRDAWGDAFIDGAVGRPLPFPLDR